MHAIQFKPVNSQLIAHNRRAASMFSDCFEDLMIFMLFKYLPLIPSISGDVAAQTTVLAHFDGLTAKGDKHDTIIFEYSPLFFARPLLTKPDAGSWL